MPVRLLERIEMFNYENFGGKVDGKVLIQLISTNSVAMGTLSTPSTYPLYPYSLIYIIFSL